MELSNENIIFDTDPRIRQSSANVPLPLNAEDKELMQALYQYVKDSLDDEMCEKRNLSPAVGIASIQVGIPKKLLAVVVPMEDGTMKEYALANPKIISKSVRKAYLPGGEGCLSVPDLHEGPVVRSNHIKVRAYDLLTDQNVVIEETGYPAIVLQHEIDHLSGILFYDRIVDQVTDDMIAVE